MFRVIALSVALLVAAAPALAADPTKPHPHQGVLAKFTDPAAPALTAADLETLARGESVLKQIKEADGSGRGIAVQDVNAAPATIWARITDYAAYPKMVDGVVECGNYATEGEHLKTRFVITAMMMNVEYYIDHRYRPDRGYMTWTLDYSRESDLDDSVGYWLVQPIAEKPGWSRVYYSVAIKLRGWVPGMVETMIAKSGLTQATGWVKRESEKAAGR